MPLFYQQNINETTRLAIWRIEEEERFFLKKVPLQKTIKHPQKRLQHLAGRYLLTYLFDDFPFEEIIIADTRKPYLPNEQYHFSISHCGSYAAAMVSSSDRVGIDIELPNPKIERVSHKFLGDAERAALINQTAAGDVSNYLTVLWSAKEAIYKWWSYGSVDFSKQIMLEPFNFYDTGRIEAMFIKDEKKIALLLNYIVFEELCLVFTAA